MLFDNTLHRRRVRCDDPDRLRIRRVFLARLPDLFSTTPRIASQTSTAATLSVIPRSSPKHLSNKGSTRISDSCAVPSYHPPIYCIPSCRIDAVRNSRSHCVPPASASTSTSHYSTNTSTTAITPTPNTLSPARGVPQNSSWPSRKGTDCSTFIRSTISPTHKCDSLPSTWTRGSNSRKKPVGIPSTAPQDTFNANTSDDGTNAKTFFCSPPCQYSQEPRSTCSG